MIKRICDECNTEIADKNFSFEAMLRQIKYPSSIMRGDTQTKPVIVAQNIHLCFACYKAKFERSEKEK